MHKWTVRDRYDHLIYLTDERWEHITSPVNHYLTTLTYTPSLAESLPITLVERPETVAAT